VERFRLPINAKTGFLFVLVWFCLGCSSPPLNKDLSTEPGEDWRVVSPEEVGMDPDLVDEMFVEIEQLGLNMDGVVVIHQGRIVAERYYPIYTQDTLHESYSITKSVISALVGIALQEGCIDNLQDPVLVYFPEREIRNLDEWKEQITIEHLLTMSSGLDWDQKEMVSSLDWVGYTLDQPVINEPGTTWSYSNGGPHVLSALIQRACGENTLNFAQEHLFGPLDISEYRWQKGHNGYLNGSWGLALTPRNLGKIGYLFLNGGVWNGQQIIPEDWVEKSTDPYYSVPDPLEPWGLEYGYLWWLHKDGPFAAQGTKGQFVYIIPDQDLVVVITANIPDDEYVLPQQLIRDYLIPAVGEIGRTRGD
jgi:CubicO group peptidase (beta-lactamase class C family)